MKKRVISAIVMCVILLPILYYGGIVFNAAVFVASLLAFKEFLDMKESKKKLPTFVKLISYLFMILMVGTNITEPTIRLEVDYRVISALFLTFLTPTILYHDKDKYNINDAFFLIGGIFFLSLSMILLVAFRNVRLALIVYLLLITILTDTFAYFTGNLIGKHKMIESISPKKTWEGSLGGTISAVFVSSVFYITVIDPTMNIFKIVLVGLFLSVIAQFGDLVFSSIKRYFGKKDFSNLIPGHGGVLDRMDSIIFVLLGFMFIWSII
ncbi:MAG: phosphatidate cytidylyltransferase [Bacilli bacterium]